MALCVAFILCFCSASAQQNTERMIIDKLNSQGKNYPQEKIHLHFDRSFYAAGDTARFAGYLVNAVKNVPSDLSRILHVELINDQNKIIKTLILQTIAGFSAGDLALSDSLPQGMYHVRAYTNWMRNFSPEFFFTKYINIINPYNGSVESAEKEGSIADNAKKYKVSFFPEGGQLINGLTARVGFKIVNWRGNGVIASGLLLDEAGKSILEFGSGHAGIGSFLFTPSSLKQYTAVFNFPDGSKQEVQLPIALNSGTILTANNSNPDSLFVKIQSTEDLLNKKTFTFIPLSNGIPLFYMDTQLPDQQISITIPKSKLPGGILQLSLLNDLNQPISERLIFNSYQEKINLALSGFKPAYQKDEKVELELQATSVTGKPIIGSFSMAIVSSGDLSANEDDEQTIYSNLLLNSDLKGSIKQPNYYFNSPSEKKDEELDGLMLTQGWSRFIWQQVSGTQLSDPVFAAERRIKISGQITGVSKGSPIANIPITLLAGELDKGMLLDTLTNRDGQFTFYLSDSLGYLPLRIQAKARQGVAYTVTINHEQRPNIAENTSGNKNLKGIVDAFKTTKDYGNYVAQLKTRGESKFNFKGLNQLKDVNIVNYNRKIKLADSHSTNLNGPGNADRVLLPDVVEKLPDLTNLDGILPIVNVPGGFRLRSAIPDGSHTPDMLVLVDGVPGLISVREISPRDVESIEFMKNVLTTAIYGIRGSGGVLLITTKKGDSYKHQKQAANSLFIPGIFALQHKFYQEAFAHEVQSNQVVKTMFWKPDLITDQQGRAKISFNNFPNLKDCTVIIEGVGARGNLVRKTIRNGDLQLGQRN